MMIEASFEFDAIYSMLSCLPGSGDGGLCLDGSAFWYGLALQGLRAVPFSGFSVFKPYSLWELAILDGNRPLLSEFQSNSPICPSLRRPARSFPTSAMNSKF